MPTYDQPMSIDYVQPSTAFGATTEVYNIIGPKGKKGLVREILCDITANMVGTTTVPEIDVGLTSGSVEYARFRLGTTAILGYTAASTPRSATQVAGNGGANAVPTFEDFTGHVKLATALIPADTAFVITRKLGVGGTPAGTGTSLVRIDWF